MTRIRRARARSLFALIAASGNHAARGDFDLLHQAPQRQIIRSIGRMCRLPAKRAPRTP